MFQHTRMGEQKAPSANNQEAKQEAVSKLVPGLRRELHAENHQFGELVNSLFAASSWIAGFTLAAGG